MVVKDPNEETRKETALMIWFSEFLKRNGCAVEYHPNSLSGVERWPPTMQPPRVAVPPNWINGCDLFRDQDTAAHRYLQKRTQEALDNLGAEV